MNVANAINLTAQIVKITTLQKNDIVKKITKDYGDSYKLSYCIVQDILNDGTNAFLQLLEFELGYNSVTPKIGMYGTEKQMMELNLFPATKEEIKMYFEEIMEKIKLNVRYKEEEFVKAKSILSDTQEFLKELTNNKLATVKYEIGK